MRRMWRIVGAAMVLGGAVTVSGAAEKTSVVLNAVHRIEENAAAVKHDASIYQWERVDDEVDRIVAAERKVHKALTRGASTQDLADTLGHDVHDLRSARMARDVKRAVQTSEKLTALIPKLRGAVTGSEAGH